jgi:hypothetical protein
VKLSNKSNYQIWKPFFFPVALPGNTHDNTLDERPSMFTRKKLIFSSGRIYVGTNTPRVQLKKSVVMGLKGLDANAN